VARRGREAGGAEKGGRVTFRYIHAKQVHAYERMGWTCSIMSAHHGAAGYWLAVKSL
jgi:hypothetical protein